MDHFYIRKNAVISLHRHVDIMFSSRRRSHLLRVEFLIYDAMSSSFKKDRKNTDKVRI